MERIASELTEMRAKERTPVMVHDDPRIIDNALPVVDDVLAEKRVLARPEIRPVAAELLQEVLADEQVAARIVIDVHPHAACVIAVAVVARNEPVVVDAPSDTSQLLVTGRRHARTSHAANVRFAEILDRVLEPMRIRICVVVDERNDLALRLPNAEVALFRRANLARGNDTKTGREGL